MNTLITKYTIYPEDIDDGIKCDAEIVFDPEGYIESFDLTAADNSNLVDYQIYCSHVIEWKEDFDALDAKVSDGKATLDEAIAVNLIWEGLNQQVLDEKNEALISAAEYRADEDR